jgi:hypothetical protein
MNRFLTVVSGALIASLPVVAFAQAPTAQPAAPAVTTVPAAQPAPTAAPSATAKSDVKAPVAGKKTEVHGMNTVKTHHAAVKAPVAPVKG